MLFEIKNEPADGRLDAIVAAMRLSSKISTEIFIEFHTDKLCLYGGTDLIAAKHVFGKQFFNRYRARQNQRYLFISKHLLGPFEACLKFSLSPRGVPARLKCEIDSQDDALMVFTINYGPATTTLTYRVRMNDIHEHTEDCWASMGQNIRPHKVLLKPKLPDCFEFILSGFGATIEQLDEITFEIEEEGIRITGCSNLLRKTRVVTEFVQNRDKYERFEAVDRASVTLSLGCVRAFIAFVKRLHFQGHVLITFTEPNFPAHFSYEIPFMNTHVILATTSTFIPDLGPEGPDAVMAAVEVCYHEESNSGSSGDESITSSNNSECNDNESVASDTRRQLVAEPGGSVGQSTSGTSGECRSIRENMLATSTKVVRTEDIVDTRADPRSSENVEIRYSSDSDQ